MLGASTFAFTVCFAIWMVFAVIGIPIKKMLALNETQFGLPAATLALTFFAYFPFTKLVHFWTLPINYFVRPYQLMRTNRVHSENRLEFALRSDKSYMNYTASILVIGVVALSACIMNGQG